MRAQRVMRLVEIRSDARRARRTPIYAAAMTEEEIAAAQAPGDEIEVGGL